MNDEMEQRKREHLKPTPHLATQTGCCHWAPIVPVATDVPDGAREETVMPNLAESAVPPVEKTPG